MPACGSLPAAVPLAAYSGGVVRSAVGDFTSSPTDDPGAPAAWLPASGTYLLALFSCLLGHRPVKAHRSRCALADR